jgi:hypothetical protein
VPQRNLKSVSIGIRLALVISALTQIAIGATRAAPQAHASALEKPPALLTLRAASIGDPVPTAQWLTLNLQAYDNQPGISIPFLELDYARVRDWLARIMELDPVTQYPLLMAAQLYGQVPDEGKQRMMLAWIHDQFRLDPDRRWRYLAHAVIMAKHRLHDLPLALSYAQDIARRATGSQVPGWARQMHIFLLEDMGEYQSAEILLGGLLTHDQVTDPHEIHFLMERLRVLKSQTR